MDQAEKAVIVETNPNRTTSFSELVSLVETAGGSVEGSLIQYGIQNPATCLRKGKLFELKRVINSTCAQLVVFNQELSGTQVRNLERELDVKVVDRTGLILDIFAQRARTAEAKLQTELAQSYYLLPRLTGHGKQLSRLGGGIGTRGPGETTLEYDRRVIKKRITRLKREIGIVRKERTEQRKRRKREFLTACLVGYTNAGKSTLFAQLTKEDVERSNMLFTTLDPTSRRISVCGADLILTDTVGFISDLPTHLISAFRATLEEVKEADIIIHVVDISHPEFREQMRAVDETLAELKITTNHRVTVFNKIDLLPDRSLISKVMRHHPNSIAISALKPDAKSKIEEIFLQFPHFQPKRIVVRLSITDRWYRWLKQKARILEEEVSAEQSKLYVEIPAFLSWRIEKFKVAA